jgi:hypothetical protein
VCPSGRITLRTAYTHASGLSPHELATLTSHESHRDRSVVCDAFMTVFGPESVSFWDSSVLCRKPQPCVRKSISPSQRRRRTSVVTRTRSGVTRNEASSRIFEYSASSSSPERIWIRFGRTSTAHRLGDARRRAGMPSHNEDGRYPNVRLRVGISECRQSCPRPAAGR